MICPRRAERLGIAFEIAAQAFIRSIGVGQRLVKSRDDFGRNSSAAGRLQRIDPQRQQFARRLPQLFDARDQALEPDFPAGDRFPKTGQILANPRQVYEHDLVGELLQVRKCRPQSDQIVVELGVARQPAARLAIRAGDRLDVRLNPLGHVAACDDVVLEQRFKLFRQADDVLLDQFEAVKQWIGWLDADRRGEHSSLTLNVSMSCWN